MRNIKKLFRAGMFTLALCLTVSAASVTANALGVAKTETQSAATAKTQNAAKPEVGDCYRLTGCRAEYSRKSSVTREDCWKNFGGNSWKSAATEECDNNPDQE